MKNQILQMMIYHQIENNETDLKLLDIQMDFYCKQFKNAITKKEINRCQNMIDKIKSNIELKINDIENLLK